MRFKISPGSSELPLVQDIPPFDGIVRLEGLNGTGKSLTTQLLALCSGRRLITGDEAWDTFCDGLSHVEVEASELQSSRTIVWKLTGATLRASDINDPLSWFDAVTIDGDEVTDFDVVRDLFAVEILKGDVGLIETLASQIDDEARIAREVSDRHFVDGLNTLGGLIEALHVRSGRLRPVEIRERAAELAALSARIEELSREDEQLQSTSSKLDELLKLSVGLSETQQTASELDAEASVLEAEIEQTESKRDAVFKDIEDLEKNAHDAESLKADLKKGTATRKRRLKKVETTSATLQDLCEDAGASPDADIEGLTTESKGELETLRRMRLDADARPAVRALIRELETPLRTAVEDGLADQVLIDGGRDGQMAVGEALEGLEVRDRLLETAVPPDGVEAIEQQIGQLEKRLAALSEIPKAREKLKRAEELLQEAEDQLEALNAQFDEDSASQLETLLKQRSTLDRALIDLGGRLRINGQRHQRLPTSAQRAQQQAWLEQGLRQVSVSERALGQEAYSAQTVLTERAAERQRQHAQLMELQAAHDRDVLEVRTFHAALLDAEFAWLADVVVAPEPEPSVEELLAMVERVLDVRASLDARLDELTTVLRGVPTTLEAIAGKLRGRDQPSTLKRDELQRWAAQLAAKWFDQDEVGDLLLEEQAYGITVDIEHRLVRWRVPGSDDERRRPLESLSSGQQAFTFTKARLALLRNQAHAPTDRLLVLDEYGAFVSHDRIRLLERLLIDWHADHPGDQILLILPAVQDYGALASTVIGEQHDLYQQRAAALSGEGYFTEPLRPA